MASANVLVIAFGFGKFGRIDKFDQIFLEPSQVGSPSPAPTGRVGALAHASLPTPVYGQAFLH